jgi:N-acetylmuramoyl-L-alanine amidase
MINSTQGVLPKKREFISPNFDARAAQIPLDLIIIHYTGMTTAEEALHRLCDEQFKVSTHFLISKRGEVYELVDPVNRAWHAGVSFWQGETDVNSRSLGIELDNPGSINPPEPFPVVQINTLLKLLEELTATFNIPRHRIIGHSDVAPLRKQDPGVLFPWQKLAENGFGIWPKVWPLEDIQNTPDFQNTGEIPREIQRALRTIGYDCPQTGNWDQDTQAVWLTFQRHFMPDQLTGRFSREGAAILTGVVHRVIEITSSTGQSRC